MNDEANNLWDYLVDTQTATESELRLITSINGHNTDTLEDVLYVRTGYRTLSQLEEMED